MRRSRKACTAISLAALSTVGASPPERMESMARLSAGKRSCAGAWNTRLPSLARSSRRDGEAMRRGQPSAWAMGVRMSGADRCAMVVPSS